MKVPENWVCRKSVFRTVLSGTITKNLLDYFVFSPYCYLFLLIEIYFHIFALLFSLKLVDFLLIQKHILTVLYSLQNHILTKLYSYSIIFSQNYIIKEMIECI